MGRLVSRYKAVVFVAALAVATPASAEVPTLKPMNYTLKYDVTFNGLPIGRVRIVASEDEYRYSASVDTKTRGLMRLFDSTKSLLSATGRKDEGKFIQKDYSSRSTDDDSTKLTTIRYGMKGEVIKSERKPPDDPANRPPVPLEDVSEALNPLTALLVARYRLRDYIAANQRAVTLRTYDGARLADLTFTAHSRTSFEIMDKRVDVVNTELTRKPIAGYKAKELKKFKEGDPVIHVYFSADERFLPVKADIAISFGTISAELVGVSTKQ